MKERQAVVQRQALDALAGLNLCFLYQIGIFKLGQTLSINKEVTSTLSGRDRAR